MAKIFLYLNTLKFLRWQQIYFRLIRKLRKPSIHGVVYDVPSARPPEWKHHVLYSNKIYDGTSAIFLNKQETLNFPDDWNNKNHSKLWSYNLHYFEDLLSVDSHKKNQFHLDLIRRWVSENPVGYGNGWEPYTLSLRIVNIIKAWLGGLEIGPFVFHSLCEQSQYLSRSIERHLLGNHYFSNLKALLFSGLVLNNREWIDLAEKGLLEEIDEQVLRDGGNFERSPMYHSLMVVDMLDLFNITQAYPNSVKVDLIRLIKQKIPSMLAFLESMSHPDQGVSFFNDSANGVAPTLQNIRKYAEALGFDKKNDRGCVFQLCDHAATGYFSATCGSAKLLFDAGDIGPDYIPGHAHADTLSFELSIGKERVIVNSGISEYGVSDLRLRQRETRSHNTIEINETNSSEVWSGFRVANRARIIDRRGYISSQNHIVIEAGHDGYSGFFSDCKHLRKIELTDQRLTIRDNIVGKFNSACSRLYFHPSLTVALTNNFLTVKGEGFLMECDLGDNTGALVESSWHPEFGVTIPNCAVEIDVKRKESVLSFTWQLT